jgi:hypothetical integral membrane protein (TIGR02206 family)
MYEFFDPTELSEVQIPMYGSIHLLTVLGMLILLALVLWRREAVKRLVNNKRLFHRVMYAYLAVEIVYWSLGWIYRIEPFYERFPLHLCATLSVIMPIVILTDKRSLGLFFSYWSLCAGFISYANPGFVFTELASFGFIHYLIRHYFLFIIPLVLQIGWEFKHTYRGFVRSAVALILWAFVIFLVDWATGANYMHLGPNNPLEIPFLPASFTAWPWSYPSFVAVGIVLFHLAFISFKGMERKKDRR